MKYQLSFILSVFLFFVGLINAQEEIQEKEIAPCHTAHYSNEFIENMTEEEKKQYLEEQEAFNSFVEQFVLDNPDVITNSNQRGITYTIPVVYHIIHEGGDENISNEQVEDDIQVMNEDFQRLNNSANNVHNAFTDIVADSEIELKLAKIDPNGNCTNGITRTFSSVTNDGEHEERINVVKDKHGDWPGDQYLNIFVVKSIPGAAGYTNYPNNSPSWGTSMGNGIHVRHNYVGSIETGATTGRNGTMTHEVGHWLNLMHTWGNSNNAGLETNCEIDDDVNDTPLTIGWTYCNVNNESCGSLDNVENYMDYAGCRKMFTLGQKARMHAALNSSVGGRNNIVSESNLEATGVNSSGELCVVDFNTSKTTICLGETIEFKDLSYHNPTKWEWDLPGASPASSTEQNPIVVYDSTGTFDVTLTIYDEYDTISVVKEAFIKALPKPANLPFIEDFEDADSIINLSWSVHNPGENAAFEIDSIAHTGYKGMRLENFGEPADNTDDLISGPLDLSHVSGDVTLSFRFAYRKRHESNDERLQVLVSNDCGENWALRKNIFGLELGDIVESEFWEPESQDDWSTIHMTNITSAFWVDDFRVTFRFLSDGGNNFYIDDINLYNWGPSELSVDKETKPEDFRVYPNPASKEVNVAFSLENGQNANVQLINAMGQTLENYNIQGKAGSNLVIIPTESFSKGVYLVKIRTDNSQQIKRIVIN